jgi:hypothetical protein
MLMSHVACGEFPLIWPTVRMTSGSLLSQPKENEIRVIERDGRRWLQQWRMPPDGQYHQRAWVNVAEIPWPTASVRPINETK